MKVIGAVLFSILYFGISGYAQDDVETTFQYRDSIVRTALDFVDKEDYESAEELLVAAELASLRAGDSINLSFAYHNAGILHYYRNDYSIAKEYFKNAYDIRVLLNDSNGQARSISNIGVVAIDQGDYTEAIGYYFKALRLYEALNDTSGMSVSFTNIGNIYYYEEKKEKALEQYFNSYELDLLLQDDYAIAEDCQNIGLIISDFAMKKGDEVLLDSAMTMYEKAIVLYSSEENNWEIADVKLEIGELLEGFGRYSEAEKYFSEALRLNTELNNRYGLAETYLSIGDVFLREKSLEKAEANFAKATSICKEIGMLDMLKTCYKSLSEVYREMGEEELAYDNLLAYISIKDSLINVHNSTVLADMDAKYQTEKKQHMIDKLEQEHLIKDAKAQRSQIILLSLLGMVISVIVFAVFIYRSLQKQREAKQLIESQATELAHQKELLQEKNTEVFDSINYARGIQRALLNSEEQLSQFLADYFVLFRPQSIVSGDFYWAEKQGKRQLFTVADCTGHGVPGGFMSMIGIILLNEIYNSKKLYMPNDILTELNRLLIISLQRYEATAVKDGMDMAFCALEYLDTPTENGQVATVWYAGANNPLYLVRQNTELPFIVNGEEHPAKLSTENAKLLEVRADRFAIGYDLETSHFTNNEIELHKGDTIYLSSDGFPDQFGGEKGKKYKYKRFKELLMHHSQQSIQSQREILNQEFEDWKQSLEQIDDVCIMGVRV